MGIGQKAKGIKRYKLTSKSRERKYHIGNINNINNITMALYGGRRRVDFPWRSLCKVYKCEISLCPTPETNIMLYVNCTLIQKSFTFQNKN